MFNVKERKFCVDFLFTLFIKNPQVHLFSWNCFLLSIQILIFFSVWVLRHKPANQSFCVYQGSCRSLVPEVGFKRLSFSRIIMFLDTRPTVVRFWCPRDTLIRTRPVWTFAVNIKREKIYVHYIAVLCWLSWLGNQTLVRAFCPALPYAFLLIISPRFGVKSLDPSSGFWVHRRGCCSSAGAPFFELEMDTGNKFVIHAGVRCFTCVLRPLPDGDMEKERGREKTELKPTHSIMFCMAFSVRSNFLMCLYIIFHPF